MIDYNPIMKVNPEGTYDFTFGVLGLEDCFYNFIIPSGLNTELIWSKRKKSMIYLIQSDFDDSRNQGNPNHQKKIKVQ